MLPTTEQEEECCLRVWLEWRNSEGLGELVPLPSAPPGPDRRYLDADGRTVGVEITRVLDPAQREQGGFAEKFLQGEVVPRVEGRVSGEVFAWVVLPWSVPQRRRRRVAEMLVDKIVTISESLSVGQTSPCAIVLDDASIDLLLLRGEGRQPALRLGAMSYPAKWVADNAHIHAVVHTVRAKAGRGQLASSGFDCRILLLHNRIPGIGPHILEQAIDQLRGEGALQAFDEIFLIDTYTPGRCLKASFAH